MSNSFHIVITSDASTEQNPENKAASFKMQLPNQLHLSEDWEVAMTHIIYPHTWQNIQQNQVSLWSRWQWTGWNVSFTLSYSNTLSQNNS